jgi:putative phosphoribosyl transferase
LLIVGGRDVELLELNRRAMRAMRCPVNLEMVPGATHLFEEPGTLERVAELSAEWFLEHLPASPR